eukprot:m.361299 g.361299  ORF g.361299 m.361299 type:complete len:92 (-) comp19478_c0_seq1:1182-1457(-)
MQSCHVPVTLSGMSVQVRGERACACVFLVSKANTRSVWSSKSQHKYCILFEESGGDGQSQSPSNNHDLHATSLGQCIAFCSWRVSQVMESC